MFRNFPENFRSRSPKVRSPGQVKGPHLRKKLSNDDTATVVERKIWNFQDLVYYQVPAACLSRIFFYIGDQRPGQLCDLPFISQWGGGETQMPQTLIRSVQIVQNHAQLGYWWWPRCNFAYVTHGKAIWGQIMTSWGQCTFLLITFGWIENWDRDLG